jgi:hypothetical protein
VLASNEQLGGNADTSECPRKNGTNARRATGVRNGWSPADDYKMVLRHDSFTQILLLTMYSGSI